MALPGPECYHGSAIPLRSWEMVSCVLPSCIGLQNRNAVTAMEFRYGPSDGREFFSAEFFAKLQFLRRGAAMEATGTVMRAETAARH
jgi:hypothetical protein